MTIMVDRRQCAACGSCVGVCPEGALILEEMWLRVDDSCTDCGLCISTCPMGALSLEAEPSPAVRPAYSVYDVIVVGAGPAGSMAAGEAARAGAKVLLLEKRQEIGSPVRCAEGVASAALQAILEPDSRWIAATVARSIVTLLTEDHEPVELSGEGGAGYVLERRLFDRYLAERAAIAGAEVRVKANVVGLLWDGRRVAGVRVRIDGQEREIGASVVIGADGVESWVGRWAGLTSPTPARDHMTCAQYVLAGIDIDPHCIRYWVSARHAPGGYIWLFPKGEGKANVGLGIQADLAKEPPRAALDRFIQDQPELSCGSPVTLVAGGVPLALAPAHIVGDGIMLVGDAAHQVDPLTGGGIINAMRAGQMAGRVAAAAVRAGRPDLAHLIAYEREWNSTIGRTLARNYRLRDRFPPDQRTSREFLRLFAVAAAGA